MICCYLVLCAAARHHSKSIPSLHRRQATTWPTWATSTSMPLRTISGRCSLTAVSPPCGCTPTRWVIEPLSAKSALFSSKLWPCLCLLVQQGQPAKLWIQLHSRRSLLIRCLAPVDTGHRRLQRVCSCALPRRGVPGQGRGKERHQSLWPRPQGRLCTEKEVTGEGVVSCGRSEANVALAPFHCNSR